MDNQDVINENMSDVMMEEEILSADLIEYIKAVEELAESDSSYVFKNSSGAHAAVVLSIMLNKSNENFYIYDNDLSGDIASRYKKFNRAVERFVADGKTLKIVVDNHSQEDTDIYKLLVGLKGKYGERVSVRRSSKEFREDIQRQYNKVINFAVGDSRMFRIEDDTDVDNRTAVCCFNNPTVAELLKESFLNAFKKCEVIL